MEIYLHRDEKNYAIKYHFDGNMELAEISESTDISKNGTYIIVTIPENVEPYEPEVPKGAISLNIKNNDYIQIFSKKHQENLQKSISKFPYIDSENINKEKIAPEIKENNYAHTIEVDRLITKYTGETFSAYMRNLYLYAYYHDIRDIVVYNVPIEEEKEHLSLMAHIIYDDTEPYDEALNILFYNRISPEAVFLGGVTKDEFCSAAKSLSNYYKADAKLGLNCPEIENTKPNFGETDNSGFKNSELFYSLDKDTSIILPFELFNSLGKQSEEIDLLKDMLQKYLERTSIRDIHINTKRGYHIDSYYRFNKIFENSQWIQRIAFRLTVKLKIHKDEYQLVGTDKYTSLIIAMALHFLGRDPAKYIILNDFEHNSISRLKKFLDPNKKTIFISSVLFDGSYIRTRIIDTLGLGKKKWIACLAIESGQNRKFESLFFVENQSPHKLYNNDKVYCSVCEEESPPLYKLEMKDPFEIENFYFGTHQQTRAIGFSDNSENKVSINWLNSLYFIHAKRGNNHYTYYTKTIDFLRNNIDGIEAYLKKVKDSIKFKQKVIIFTPVHNTNNRFVALVNKIVFDNNATIKHFERAKGESNFHSFSKDDTRLLDGIEESALYFVDDEISSGYTLEYFYGLLRSIPGVVDRINAGFDGVIVMVDRMSAVDETIICNYLRDDYQEKISFDKKKSNTSVERLSRKLDLFHAFTKLNIRPIKTETEECYLCKQRELYEDLLGKSVLDLTRYQFAHRVVRLNQTDSDDIEYNCHFSLQYRIKLWVKKISIEFLVKEFKSFEELHDKHYNVKLVKDNVELINGYNKILEAFYIVVAEEMKYQELFISKFGPEAQGKDIQETLNVILKYEARVALLKAMSFPKLVFYKIIKDIATTVVYGEIREYRKNQVNHWRREKEIIKSQEKDIKPEDIQNKIFLKIRPLISVPIIKNNELKKYFGAYAKKTDMDEMNFYYVTAAYLNMHYILDKRAIELYYQQVRTVKYDREKYDSAILHAYPFAVKLLVSQDKDKAKYFDNSLKRFYKQFNQSRDTSLVNALYLENNILISKNIRDKKSFERYCRELIRSDQDVSQKMEKLATAIKSILKKNLTEETYSNIKLEHIFINENMNNNYRENYRRYLDRSILRDVTKSFNKLEGQAYQGIADVYRGAQSKNDNAIERKQINNSWANDFIRFKSNDSKCHTVVRLVHSDANKLEDVKNNALYFLRKKTNFVEKDTNIRRFYLPKKVSGFKKEDSIKYNIPKVWMKPIGCIVVSHLKDNYADHLDVAKVLLAVQNEIVYFFREELRGEAFKEAIRSKEYKDFYNKFMHGQGELFQLQSDISFIVEDISKEIDNVFEKDFYKKLEKLRYFATGVSEISLVTQLPLEKIKKRAIEIDIFRQLKRHKSNVEKFINFANSKDPSLCKKVRLIIEGNSFMIPLARGYLKSIIYELAFNASKHGLPDENGHVQLIFNISPSTLQIKNKIPKEDSNNNTSLGIEKIKDIFEKIGYSFEVPGISKSEYFIQIKRINND